MKNSSVQNQISYEQWINEQLSQLEQQFQSGNLTVIGEATRERIENAIRDLYDIDDVNLLFGTAVGCRYMRLRAAVSERPSQSQLSVA